MEKLYSMKSVLRSRRAILFGLLGPNGAGKTTTLKIIGYSIVLLLVPFMYPSIFSLVMGNVDTTVSWLEVGICIIFAVLLLTLTTHLSRYLSNEKIITTLSV